MPLYRPPWGRSRPHLSLREGFWNTGDLHNLSDYLFGVQTISGQLRVH